LRIAGGNQAALLGQFALRLQAFGFASGEGCVGAVDGQVEIITFEHQQLPFSTCWLSWTSTLSMRAPNWLDTRVISPCT
jgi:hypothetical protein